MEAFRDLPILFVEDFRQLTRISRERVRTNQFDELELAEAFPAMVARPDPRASSEDQGAGHAPAR